MLLLHDTARPPPSRRTARLVLTAIKRNPRAKEADCQDPSCKPGKTRSLRRAPRRRAGNITEHGAAHLLAEGVRTYDKSCGPDGASPPSQTRARSGPG